VSDIRLPRILDESYRVAWGDLCYFKENAVTILISCLIGPLLYLVAFGYGIGSGMQSGVDDYVRFIIPGIISMATLSATFSFVSSKILIQKLFYTSFDELLLCPIKPSSVVLGKCLAGILRGMCSCVIILMIGLLISPGIKVTAFLFVLAFIASLTFSLLGILAGLLAKKHNTLTVFSSLVIVPMTFFSGTIFDISNLPAVLKYAVYALPLTHQTESIRAVMLDLPIPWLSVVIMCIYCSVFFFVSYYLIKRRSF
jgi:ABC-type polysaccharide/polyol phosphate export permease